MRPNYGSDRISPTTIVLILPSKIAKISCSAQIQYSTMANFVLSVSCSLSNPFFMNKLWSVYPHPHVANERPEPKRASQAQVTQLGGGKPQLKPRSGLTSELDLRQFYITHPWLPLCLLIFLSLFPTCSLDKCPCSLQKQTTIVTKCETHSLSPSLAPCHGAFSVFSQDFTPTYGKTCIIHYSNFGQWLFWNTIHVVFPLVFHYVPCSPAFGQRREPSLSALGMGWPTEYVGRNESTSGFWISKNPAPQRKRPNTWTESWESMGGASSPPPY